MSDRVRLEGFPASEGLALGAVQVLQWGIPRVEHVTVSEEQVAAEVERFHEALRWSAERLRELQARTSGLLGAVEARIFDPQVLMLEDPLLISGTERYIRENRLSAARAFDWRILELKAEWNRSAHPMVLDRLNDLEDLQSRVLSRLLGVSDSDASEQEATPRIVIATNLTPSLAVRMDPSKVLGIATEQGARTSHWAILARSMSIPAVVAVPGIVAAGANARSALVDGRHGRVILDPDAEDIEAFEQRNLRLEGWSAREQTAEPGVCRTSDGQEVVIRANLDLPLEAPDAARRGALGVGLFRTEFLVVGRRTMPDEEEQYEAYRTVGEAFPGLPIVIRTFDLGGDKFPLFLASPAEENPFLGWRAIRVCLDRPELFRPQLRALLRASVEHDLRVMLPLVNTVEEVQQVKALLEEERDNLSASGVAAGWPKIGLLIETPAAALHADVLVQHCDFLSIGTNDLVQYTLAVDRTSARLASRYTPFHPGVLHQLARVVRIGEQAGVEVGICGEMASDPLGAFLFVGLGVRTLSVAWHAVPEMRELLGHVHTGHAEVAARNALAAGSSAEIVEILSSGLEASTERDAFPGRWRPEPRADVERHP